MDKKIKEALKALYEKYGCYNGNDKEKIKAISTELRVKVGYHFFAVSNTEIKESEADLLLLNSLEEEYLNRLGIISLILA